VTNQDSFVVHPSENQQDYRVQNIHVGRSNARRSQYNRIHYELRLHFRVHDVCGRLLSNIPVNQIYINVPRGHHGQ